MANTVDKVLKLADEEVGYLEKSEEAYRKNPNVLYDKTAGAGQDNYTKYGKEMHDIYPSVMDFPAFWCDCLVDWLFYKAYGVSNAKALIGGDFNDYTVASCQLYKNKGALDTNPTIGAQVFFTKNGEVSGCHHTGLVIDVDKKFFYTIEGNTNAGNSLVRNGGGVAKKKYAINAYKGKVLFGHPKYDKGYKVSYELNGGKFDEYNEPVYGDNGSLILPIPTRDGFVFDGWYKDNKRKTRVFAILPDNIEDVKLSARWIAGLKYGNYKTTEEAYVRPTPSTDNKIKFSDLPSNLRAKGRADEKGFAIIKADRAFTLTLSVTDIHGNVWGKMKSGYYLPVKFNGKVRVQ